MAWKRAISSSRSVGDRIDGNPDGEIGCAAERLAGPVGALIETVQDFYQSDGIDFVDAAGFRIVADRGRIAGDGENIAHAADGPCAQQSGLQPDDILIPRGEMRNGFHAARFESAGNDECVHADASHGAGIDVDGMHFAGGHDLVDLLVDAIERNALGRVDFHADLEFSGLQVFPELAFRRAIDWRSGGGCSYGAN